MLLLYLGSIDYPAFFSYHLYSLLSSSFFLFFFYRCFCHWRTDNKRVLISRFPKITAAFPYTITVDRQIKKKKKETKRQKAPITPTSVRIFLFQLSFTSPTASFFFVFIKHFFFGSVSLEFCDKRCRLIHFRLSSPSLRFSLVHFVFERANSSLPLCFRV